MKLKKCVVVLASLFLLNNCAEDELNVDLAEGAQQIGDVMASIDEAGGNTGSLALLHGQSKYFAKKEKTLPGSAILGIIDIFNPIQQAEATACKDATTFNSCTNNVITRDFAGCTVGSATFTGNVTLSYNDAGTDNTCQLASTGHSITRVPNFQVTGRREATLTVSKSGTVGQVITRGATANDLTFSNDGIRRVFSAAGEDLFDFTTLTTSNITITGAARNGRVLNGGNLRVTNNISNLSCNYVPTNVTWSSSCNCASSGSWTGTCSDGKSSAVEITGCGSAIITMSDKSESLTFDRCYSTN
jgi:hypothetical protein